MRLRLNKSEVIRGSGRFSEIIRKGKRLHARHLECSYRISRRAAENPEPGVMIGFAVGRQVRRAVDRNRIRRLMREAYRINKHLVAGENAFTDSGIELILHFPRRNVRFTAPPSYGDISGDMQLILSRIVPLLTGIP